MRLRRPLAQKVHQRLDATRLRDSVLILTERDELPQGLGFRMSAWATVLSGGGYATVHDHGDAHLSAVYWAAAGDPGEPGGWLEFVDPRRSSLELPELPALQSRVRVRPKTGALVIFPGYLQHFVHPYHGQAPRVSLAANAVVSLGY